MRVIVLFALLYALFMLVPSALSTAHCRTVGDPHYRSFDGKRFSFMGACEYILATDTAGTFEILSKNRPCGGWGWGRWRASCADSISVHVKGLYFHVQRGRRPTVFGTVVELPYKDRGIVMKKHGNGANIISDLGFSVRYDGSANLWITVSNRYRGKMRGLCGNYNGNSGDDFTMPNGQRTSSVSTFGNSWRAHHTCRSRPQPPPPCRFAHDLAQKAKKECTLLREKPFSKCHKSVKVANFITTCEYDVCACKDHPLACLCEEYSGYADECALAHIKFQWKNVKGFKLCASPCASDPCLNNGNCTNIGKYSFKCTHKTYCKNKDINTFKCACPEPYFGSRCEKVEPCVFTPCHNDGFCTNKGTQIKDFECECRRGYAGKSCDVTCPKPCDSVPCKHGGQCTNEGLDDHRCKCHPDYIGKSCQKPNCLHAKPLGVESNKIPDDQITASSSFSRHYAPSNGRLNFKAGGGKAGAWSARYSDVNQWIQYEFKSGSRFQATVTKILTQGRQDHSEWVTKFTLSYSNDGNLFEPYLQGLNPKVFRANSDRNTVVTHNLSPVIVARFVRIQPKSWKGHISMRAGFRGCFMAGPCAGNPCRNNGLCTNTGAEEFTCKCPTQYIGETCDIPSICTMRA